MTKQKTRKELEKKYKEANEDRVFFIITIIVLMLCGFYYSSKSDKLETQLSECQDKVFPCCNDLFVDIKGDWKHFTPLKENFWILNGVVCRVDCQDKVGKLENIKVTPTTFSYWQYDGNDYSNYICVGGFYINGNKVEVPEELRVEIRYWKGTWIWNRENCEVIE